MPKEKIFSIAVIVIFLGLGIQYARLTKPRRFWNPRLTTDQKLGPALFIVLAAVTTYLGCWLPDKIDSQFEPDVDSRIGMVVAGFAPFTVGMAVWAVFSYIRLLRIQRQDFTIASWIWLAVLALPLVTSIYLSVPLVDAAIYFLPSFLQSLFYAPLEWFGR